MAASPQSGNLKASAGPPAAGAPTSAVTGAGKWLITLSVLLGTFMSVMDVSVVNVAMPHMMGSFGQDLLSITWVSTAYSIAEIIMITMSGWWSTLLGRKRFFLGSMVLFTIGSIMAGSSRTFAQMVTSRVIQGIGGGGLIPVSQAIARETFPPAEQGMAMALFNMGVVVAPTVGPTLGGWLVDNWGWQWVFFINLPICVLAVTMVSTFVHDPPYLKRGVTRIDWGGIAALTVGLTALQVVLERGQEMDWFASNLIFAGTIIAVVSLVALVGWELNIREPVIQFRLLRNVPLAVGSIIAACISFMLFGSTFVIPQWVQTLMGYPAYQAGMLMLPRALTMLIVLPLVGRLYNYTSPPLLVACGNDRAGLVVVADDALSDAGVVEQLYPSQHSGGRRDGLPDAGAFHRVAQHDRPHPDDRRGVDLYPEPARGGEYRVRAVGHGGSAPRTVPSHDADRQSDPNQSDISQFGRERRPTCCIRWDRCAARALR